MNGYSIVCKSEEGHQFFIKNLEANTFRVNKIKSWLKNKLVKED